MSTQRMKSALVCLLAATFFLSQPTQAQDLPEPIKDLAPVYDKEPEFVEGLRAWGKAQIAAAEADIEAARELDRAKKRDDAKAKATDAKAKIRAVREAYEFALKKYEKNARLHNTYGEILYDHFEDAPGALREWNTAIDIDDKYAPPYNNLGLDQCHTGSYEIGIQNLEKALELDPKNPDFMFNIAQIYLVHFPQVEKIKKWKPKKIYDQAMKLSKKATELAPDDYQLAEDYAVNFFAAENFKVEANWPEAVAAWQHARGLATRPDRTFFTWLNEARCLLRDGKPAEAKTRIEEALKIMPDSPVAKQLLEKATTPQPAEEKPKKKRGK